MENNPPILASQILERLRCQEHASWTLPLSASTWWVFHGIEEAICRNRGRRIPDNSGRNRWSLPWPVRRAIEAEPIPGVFVQSAFAVLPPSPKVQRKRKGTNWAEVWECREPLGGEWCTGQDLNLQPSDPKSDTLSN